MEFFIVGVNIVYIRSHLFWIIKGKEINIQIIRFSDIFFSLRFLSIELQRTAKLFNIIWNGDPG